MPVKLHCVEDGHVGEEWTLDLDGPMAVVRGPLSDVLGEFRPEEVGQRVQLPSFSESIRFFGVQLDGRLWRFEVSKVGLREVRAFINRNIVAAGPDAVMAVRTQAIRNTLIGIVAVIGGVVVPNIGLLIAANKPDGGIFHVSTEVVIIGVIVLAKGISGFVQYRNLREQ